MNNGKHKDQTAKAIGKCAEYLVEHQEELAEQFCAMPSLGWSIEFRAGEGDGSFPWVEVHASQQNIDVIHAYSSQDEES